MRQVSTTLNKKIDSGDGKTIAPIAGSKESSSPQVANNIENTTKVRIYPHNQLPQRSSFICCGQVFTKVLAPWYSLSDQYHDAHDKLLEETPFVVSVSFTARHMMFLDQSNTKSGPYGI